MRQAGHLFVLHGRIESVVHDAAVVPVGAELRIREHWRPLVGPTDPEPPDAWPDVGCGSRRPAGALPRCRSQLEWLHLEDAGHENGPRALEIFLDRVALHASSGWSWLLDDPFESLLPSARDRELARAARELYERLPSLDGMWAPLQRSLEQMGAATAGAVPHSSRHRRPNRLES